MKDVNRILLKEFVHPENAIDDAKSGGESEHEDGGKALAKKLRRREKK
ncbi:MAG: hypothetical protein H7Y42_10710 [Chitinophagaceae bacterium]|nr:hypothetical protein [Chitinophagaceae bacterium]